MLFVVGQRQVAEKRDGAREDREREGERERQPVTCVGGSGVVCQRGLLQVVPSGVEGSGAGRLEAGWAILVRYVLLPAWAVLTSGGPIEPWSPERACARRESA